MARTERYAADSLARKEKLANRGKLPVSGKSRRSDLIRAIAEDLEEAEEIWDYPDEKPCMHDYDCDCALIELEARMV